MKLKELNKYQHPSTYQQKKLRVKIMNNNDESEQKDMSKRNIWFAVILGLIAFTVALMPFFYLTNAVVSG